MFPVDAPGATCIVLERATDTGSVGRLGAEVDRPTGANDVKEVWPRGDVGVETWWAAWRGEAGMADMLPLGVDDDRQDVDGSIR